MKAKKVILILLVILSSFVVVEFIFRNVVASVSERPTLVRNNWLKKYWFPVNSMGYRDYDYYLKDLKNKKNIVVVGDSITAGFGIKDYKNRYPNLLQGKLGNEWQIINIGIPGWNIEDKVDATLRYPYLNEVKLIIFQYYFDDQVPAGIRYCGKPPAAITDTAVPDTYSYYPVRKSYFINYVYWRLYELTFIFRKDLIRKFDSYLQCAENNKEKVSEDAFKSMGSLIDLCRQKNIRLVVLNVPHLEIFEDIRNKTNASWKNMHSVLDKNNISSIDVSGTYNQHRTISLRVNLSDCHPNEKAHKIIADCLYEELNRQGILY